MELKQCGMALAASDYSTVAILIVVVVALAGMILVLAHLIGPRRHGPIKDATYESGMTPYMDARRRFNVRFYMVAVMYVVFGVEVIFLYPWAVAFPQLRMGLTERAAPPETLNPAQVELAHWAGAVGPELAEKGYGAGPAYLLAALLVFFALLGVGFIYEWRKGVFKWD